MHQTTATLIGWIIDAAREGRYCHGNGAIYCIVDRVGNHQVIDLNGGMFGTMTLVSQPNPVEPHVSISTATNLEDFLSRHYLMDNSLS